MKSSVSNLVYQLKITLLGSAPPIWRRLLVPRNVTLKRLHFIIQKAMGWETKHLHLFEIGNRRYGESDPEWDDVQDHASVRLYNEAYKAGQSLLYVYDIGDGWQHQVEVETISRDPRYFGVPVCLEGAGACPPEDCGGIGGYGELLEILADPRHERYRRMKQWLGGPFDPDVFDLDATNEALAASLPKKVRLAAALKRSKAGLGPLLH
jgi:hypothetical protein